MHYFPSFSKTRKPNRAYLLNIINTIRPNSLTKAMRELLEKRTKQTMECGDRIEITNDYMKFLAQYQQFGKHGKPGGLNLLKVAEPSKNTHCLICFEDLGPEDQKKFNCQRHGVHVACYQQYQANPISKKFLCPYRCSNPRL